jgi:hypothetical protein
MTNNAHQINSADVRRRQIRLMQALFAGAATVATLALFSAGPSDPQTAVASGAAGSIIAVDDGSGVNDQGQTGGDIFTQNAQDQSTASGAGT